jgi:hypothetical protein
MKNNIAKLRRLEKTTYFTWLSSTRDVGTCRNNTINATQQNKAEKKSLLEMAIIRSEDAFRCWEQVCQQLDELEIAWQLQDGWTIT